MEGVACSYTLAPLESTTAEVDPIAVSCPYITAAGSSSAPREGCVTASILNTAQVTSMIFRTLYINYCSDENLGERRQTMSHVERDLISKTLARVDVPVCRVGELIDDMRRCELLSRAKGTS